MVIRSIREARSLDDLKEDPYTWQEIPIMAEGKRWFQNVLTGDLRWVRKDPERPNFLDPASSEI